MIRSRATSSTSLTSLTIGLLACLLASPSFAVVGRQVERVDPRERIAPAPGSRLAALDPAAPTAAGQAVRAFVDRHGGSWTFRVDPRTGRLGLAQGSGVALFPGRGNDLDPATMSQPGQAATLADLEPAARAFVDTAKDLLVPERGRLAFNEALSRMRDDRRVISFYYDWLVDGVPVEAARVFVRVNSGNVTQFGTRLVGPIAIATDPAIAPADAVARLLDHSGDRETALLDGEPLLTIQVEGTPAGGLAYRLVWKIRYTRFADIAFWEGRVDARTGAVVGFRDTTLHARAVAGVYRETPFESTEVRVPLADLDIFNGGTTLFTDGGGSVAHPGGPLVSGMTGRYFNISCQDCNFPEQPIDGTDVGSGWLDFGFGGVDAFGNGNSTPADRNAFYHLNRIRRLALEWLPIQGFTASNQFLVRTNIASICNASFSPGVSINLFNSGGGCNNTGEIADVIRHEWGHGLDLDTMPGDGGTGEGTADVVAMHMSHDSRLGPGFRVDGSSVRNLDKTVSPFGSLTLARIENGDCNVLPDDGLSVHCVGQVFGQTAWDLKDLLVARHGHHTGWRTSARLFFTSLPDAETYDPASTMSIYAAYLQADDDDGNLANGTPHGVEIHQAFADHGIAQGPVGASPECARPAQPALAVDPTCTRFNISWTAVAGAARYDILRADLREDTAYLKVGEVNGATTTFIDAEVLPDVDYWYTVMAVDAAGCESTVEDPVPGRLPDQAILDISAVVVDDSPLGNRSGGADPGETVDLRITLENVGMTDAVDPTARIFVSTAGVALLEDTAAWPSTIPAGESAENVETLRFRINPTIPCASPLHFQMLPSDAGSGCTSRVGFFEVRVGLFDGNQVVCDDTPPCFTAPDFDGIASVVPGASCGRAELSWQPAATNCINAVVTYNVYRDTDPAFVPGPASLIASGVTGTAYSDELLTPGVTYHYVVQPVDSRSGEAQSGVVATFAAPFATDVEAPQFAGLEQLATGVQCGEIQLDWQPALESCGLPVVYEIHRSANPHFVPGPESRIGETLAPGFVDAALNPGERYYYAVRARDSFGNTDDNLARHNAPARSLDLTLARTDFEADDGGFTLGIPDDAAAGNWEWGDPLPTAYQPDDDATPDPGVNCWMTGLGTQPTNGDVDDGTTTLVSPAFDLSQAVDPVLRYARWFTNDRGAGPGEATDLLTLEVSTDDGASWAALSAVGAGTDLEWVTEQHALIPGVNPSTAVRFRFMASDLGAGSLVEAGIDDFEIADRGQGCAGCPVPAPGVTSIHVDLAGDDVVVDWSSDHVAATRYVVYGFSGPSLAERVRLGTTVTRTFVHTGAATTDTPFYYRVTAVDACGIESRLD